MIDCAKLSSFLRTNLVNMKHEGRWATIFKIFVLSFYKDRRRKGTKPFAMFDAGVQDILHVGQARVSYNGPVPQCARAPLHPSLKPAHYISRGDQLCHCFE